LHIDDMEEVGRPLRRSKSATLEMLQRELGTLKFGDLDRERLTGERIQACIGDRAKTTIPGRCTAYTLSELAAEVLRQTGKTIPYSDVPASEYEDPGGPRESRRFGRKPLPRAMPQPRRAICLMITTPCRN
jgi:hypothetical protein